MNKIRSSEITPEHVYLSRRKFLTAMGLGTANVVLAACGIQSTTPTEAPVSSTNVLPTSDATTSTEPASTNTVDELGNALTPFEAVTNYNNFYEFSVHKDEVARMSEGFKTEPWSVHIRGAVAKPRKFNLEDILKIEQEDRIYRMRCVEAWSMVIPWQGFPLAKLLAEVEPLSSAKYVRFETLHDPERLPGQNSYAFPWPYVEGLRLDEAMHDLTIMSTGLYGKTLLPQNGAPLRLVVPWKYGFKSIKSIVKIELVEDMPTTLWMASGPSEYGFWANVNPEVDHPRWSQATERRIGINKRVETLFFNGYAEEVAELYPDLDKRGWYY